jgi:hypothetical protein
MVEPYKKEHSGSFLVAVKVSQKPEDQIHAPSHIYFGDENGPLNVKCPKCEDSYSIGYEQHYSPNESFETLSKNLIRQLVADHSNGRKHKLTYNPREPT